MPGNFGEGSLRRIAEQTAEALRPAVPFVVHALASGTAFTIGLVGTQFAGAACRVSSANVILGGSLGMVGVGVSSAMAGQAAIHCRHHFSTGQHPFTTPRSVAFRRQDLLLDACMGIVLYQLMGGKFRNLMPSDLFKAGAMARESLPALGKQYAVERQRGELKLMMRRDGCHHCGRRKGATVGDHIPPNRVLHGSKAEQEIAAGIKQALGTVASKKTAVEWSERGMTVWRRLRGSLGQKPASTQQRYYPQCTTCMQKQSAACRAKRRTLVLHNGGPKPWYYAGILVGMRHFHSPASASAVLMNDLQNARQHMHNSNSWKQC